MLTSLALIFLVGLAMAALCQMIRLPRIIGMLLTGILLGPYVLNLLDDSILMISADLREMALVIILIKAGLSLKLQDLKAVGRPALMMSFVPASFEIVAYTLFAPLVLGLTRVEAAVMGSVLAAVSPAVVVPRMVQLMEEGRGTKQHIPQMILAGASLDDVFVIVLFSTFTGMAQGGTADLGAFAGIPVSIVLGIAVGALFTALIQSSSASVGILQALATSGAISFSSSVFILFGQNIGTCITAVLASIGTSRSAKRATIIHLMFNIIGTVLFTILCILFPLADLVASFTPDAPAAQIANMHTIFNIVTTLLLLPLGNQLASLAVRILPEQPEENRDEMHLEYLTPVQVSSKDGNLGASAIHIGQLQQELDRMLDMAQDNIETSFDAVLSRDSSLLTKAEKMESYLDFLNKEISKYISRLITYETNEQGSSIVSSYFTITGNIERIGDHAINICGYSKLLEERHIQFSAQAQEEICQMRDICLEALNALHQREAGDLLWLTDVSALEQRIDDMTDLFRKDQLERMKAGTCSDEACILYSELLTDFERIGDHVLNIAQEMSSIREHS